MSNFAKLLGITLLLIVVCTVAMVFEFNKFTSPTNIDNVLARISMFSILAIGVAFVIVTGGIDLSIGSVVALVGCLLPIMLVEYELSVWVALPAIVVISLAIGLAHGLLITKLKLQPFVVTLCGLLIYRSIARWLTDDATQGYGAAFKGLRSLGTGTISLFGDYRLPVPLLVMIGIAILAAIFLNKTIYGRYLFALGRNEQAARYSGIRTDAMVILSYAICSLMAGIGGILFSLELNSVQPAAHGNFYELYAIAAAVIGGCSLRGGEGSIVGVVIGAAVMQLLYNVNFLLGGSDKWEYGILGIALLLAVVADEALKRVFARRRRAAEAKRLTEPGSSVA